VCLSDGTAKKSFVEALPGLAPAGHLPFFFAKKVGQDGDRTSLPAAVPEEMWHEAGSVINSPVDRHSKCDWQSM
jgi:hypothetical protein